MPGARNCVSPKTSGSMLVGEEHLGRVDGAMHSKYHRLVLSSMTPEVLKHHVQRIDKITRDHLRKWEWEPSVQAVEELNKISCEVITGFLCDKLKPSNPENKALVHDVLDLSHGFFTYPINLPFTGYHRAVQARKRLHQRLDKLIMERRNSEVKVHDLLQKFIEETNKDGSKLTNTQIEGNMLACLLAGQHTTPAVLVWLLKLLNEHPDVLKQVEEEQNKILNAKSAEEKLLLTWEDTKLMPLTLRVIEETIRISNGGMLIREMKETVECNGYVIPKGWMVHVYHSYIHKREDYFPDPWKFDPFRTNAPGTFVGFGLGIRLCPGAELARLEMLIFVHRLVTQYSWEPLNPNEKIVEWPFPLPADGYKLRIKRKSTA